MATTLITASHPLNLSLDYLSDYHILEELSRVSLRDGALASTPPERGFSLTVIFSYQILPTISTVIYSLAWSWADLDIRATLLDVKS